MKLFDRKWKLIVKPYEGKSFSNFAAGEDLSDLDFTFEAKKTSIPLQPNTLKLSIFNLSKATRSMLESGKNRVILEAGYKERDDVTAFGGGTGMAKIFNGQVRAAWSDGGKGPDWVTHLDTGDGFMEMALAQLNVNLEPKVS